MKHSKQHNTAYIFIYLSLFFLHGCVKNQVAKEQGVEANSKTPYQIVDEAPASDWRGLDLSNSLYIQLEKGVVIVEMAPQFAPLHVDNTKALVRQGIFDNTNFYRVIDGFVAQGGPADVSQLDAPKAGSFTIQGEFSTKTDESMPFTPLGEADSYADEVGYVSGFAVGRSRDKKESWLLHCYAALAMGRANEKGSGGTELYAVIGHAQRYLDKNTTVFGRVVYGMEYIQQLERSTNLQGAVDLQGKNKIANIKVASDLAADQLINIEVMKTDSDSFRALIKSRKNRLGDWFIYAHDYIDVCGVAVPMRLTKSGT